MFDLIAEIKQISKLLVVFGFGFVGLYIIFTEVATRDGVTAQGASRAETSGSAVSSATPPKPATKE